MKLSLRPSELLLYVQRLIETLTPMGKVLDLRLTHIDTALERTEYCFNSIKRKYFNHNGQTVFDHLHGDHFATFLWFLSNTVWSRETDAETPTRLCIVNRALHGIDLFYNVEMPNIFMLAHPLASIIGRGTYADYLVVHQHCTIGQSAQISSGGKYPTFLGPTLLYSGVSIIGNCTIGSNVVFGAQTSILNMDIPDNSLVTGRGSDLRVRPNEQSVFEREFSPADSK